MSEKSLILPGHLKARLAYDVETGVFRWRYNPLACDEWNEVNSGNRADLITEDGYRRVTVNHVTFQAHRAAFACMLGRWPRKFVDHIDGCKTNNRWENLREATASENAANRAIRCDNTSGHKGISFKKQTGKWVARITFVGKEHHLGYFDTIESAVAARKLAETKYHGEFAPSFGGRAY